MRPSVNTRALVTLMRNAIWGGGGRRPFIFNGGEGTGGIRRVAPVVYDEPPLHKRVFGRPPFVSQIIILTGMICPWAGNLVANF